MGSAPTNRVSCTLAADECVYRGDTLVLLELTTRDMMEARGCQLPHEHVFLP